MDERFGKLLAYALEETDSIEEATVAAMLAYEMPPLDAMLGMDAQGRWHGPQPPGPGWVQVGEGPSHGKIWANQGSQQPVQPPAQPQAPQPKIARDAFGRRIDPEKERRRQERKQQRNEYIGAVRKVFGESLEVEGDDVYVRDAARDFHFEFDPSDKSVFIDFTQSPQPEQQGNAYQVVATELQPGTVDLMHKMKDFISILGKNGMAVSYETMDERRRRIYARVLQSAGFTEVPSNDPERSLWKPPVSDNPIINQAVKESPSAHFALDIHDRVAQGILNKAMAAAKKLSAQARRELAAALKQPPDIALHAIAAFLDRYRVQLARLLSTTQLAALLEGAREVARHIPVIPPPGMDVLPPSLGPMEAVALVEQLRGLEGMAREEAIYRLSPAEQRYVRQAIAIEGAPPPPLRLPAPPAGEPEGVHWPVLEEAARQLAEKNVVTRESFDRLDAAARQKAFTITGIDSREALTKIRDLLAQQVAEGPDYAAFRKTALASVDEAGMLADHHLELVFRNAIQTAFSDGQMTVLSHPFVRSGFPYSTYDAIHDDRVRPTHLALEKYGIGGSNIYRQDDPVFQMFRPPWADNDRCGWTPLTVRQAAERGIEEAKTWLATGVEPEQKAWVAPPPFVPDPRFQRSLEGMPLSIQLACVSATEMLQPQASPTSEVVSRIKSRRGKRKARKRVRPVSEWRSIGHFSAMFGLDPQGLWHGPKPPGAGWVQVGKGTRGGLIWKNQGGQQPQAQQPAPQQPQTPAQMPQQQPAPQPMPTRDPAERAQAVAQDIAANPLIKEVVGPTFQGENAQRLRQYLTYSPHEDGLSQRLDRVYAGMKRTMSDLTPETYKQFLMDAWKNGAIELKILNEVRDVSPEQRGLLPEVGENTYGYAAIKDRQKLNQLLPDQPQAAAQPAPAKQPEPQSQPSQPSGPAGVSDPLQKAIAGYSAKKVNYRDLSNALDRSTPEERIAIAKWLGMNPKNAALPGSFTSDLLQHLETHPVQ